MTGETILEKVSKMKAQRDAARDAFLALAESGAWGDVAGSLTCAEANKVAVALDELGLDADAFILMHSDSDDEDDEHHGMRDAATLSRD